MNHQEADVKTATAETAGAERTRSGFYYRPNVDIVEGPEELLVLADVPGVSGDQVDVRFEDGVLSIHARVEPRHEDEQYLLREYGIGDYYRSFEISEAIDASRISADCAGGVLTLHLPKAEAIKPRKISVASR